MHKLILITIFYFTIVTQNLQAYENNASIILEADEIGGDRKNETINAKGNVIITRGRDILISDKINYNKKAKIIEASGNIKIKGDEIGNIFANEANMKDDFTSGSMLDAKIIFDDGSYATSPKIVRESKDKSILSNSIFSFCPNPKILLNKDSIKDDISLISLKSGKTTIDKKDGSAKIKNGFLNIRDIPVFYTPYFRFPLRSAKRRSGFLQASYTNTDNLGFGIKLPYYFNIAPNKDLTSTIQHHPSANNIIFTNHYRHLLRNGRYDAKLELANNNLDVSSDNSNNRWYLRSKGKLTFSENLATEFDIDYVGDKHYLRDYKNDFVGYKVSKINMNHIKDNNYNSIKALKIQELEVNIDSREEINAIPVINSYFESDVGKFSETYSILTNSTIIFRRSGLQYRRITVKPKISIPYNISGNIFKFSSSLQTDLYNLDDNYTSTAQEDRLFDNDEFDYRPQISLSWNLPLIKKSKNSSFIFDPKINFVSSNASKNNNGLPNEDSSNTELTQGNLFLEDRFIGFDRNESGERLNLGFTSNLFNKYGNFGFGLGQSYRKNSEVQDVVIRGFNENKSNIVGEISYNSPKIFSVIYNFQLNESNYTNDINELSTNFKFKSLNISSNYILIRKSANNLEKKEQATINVRSKLYGKLVGNFSATKDVVSNRIIEKKVGISYDGCCVSYGFTMSQSNPSLLIESKKSYNINFRIKNL